MRAVVQRVCSASVEVDGELVGDLPNGGLLVLLGVTHEDTVVQASTMSRKLAGLRILPGELAVGDVPGAGVLVVSQFTLYGDTRKGRRPSWSAAAPGPVAEPLVDAVVAELRVAGLDVATGRFGADMKVALVNDGPFTLVVEV